jgi:hypothetical protein
MKRSLSWVLGCSLGLQGVCFAQEATNQAGAGSPVEGEVAAEQLQPPKAYTEKLHQMQWVQVDAEGRFSGSVVSLFRGGTSEKIANAQVALIRSGQVKSSTTTDEKGDFSFSGVLPGSYTIEGLGTNGTFSFALNVLPGQAVQGSEMKIYAVVPGGSTVTKYFARYMVPSSTPDMVGRGVADQRFVQSNGQVRADENGVFHGILLLPGAAFASKDMSATEVIILQNGREVAKAMANADGSFSIRGLESGVYGLVVAGPIGRAAVAFELIEHKPVVQVGSNQTVRLVSFQEGAADSLNIELAPPASPSEDELALEDLGMPVPGGGLAGPGGSGAGSGGAGGAAGGAGGLLGLAAAAGAIVALTSDDDDNNVASPIVNP